MSEESKARDVSPLRHPQHPSHPSHSHPSPHPSLSHSHSHPSLAPSLQLHIKDRFCWLCHKPHVDHSCQACLRSYHRKCVHKTDHNSHNSLHSELSDPHLLCRECEEIMRAEERHSPPSLHWPGPDQLAQLLQYTIVTVKAADKRLSFQRPVSAHDHPEYSQVVVNPMDLSLVERNVDQKLYASTHSFLADIKWIYHNCVVFNSGGNHALISEAKNIIRVAKQECEEIEICPDCYLNYYSLEEKTFFSAVCRKPHAIVWAKLKGHPYWPAKVVRYNEARNEVDVRFFGTHDKCWLRPEKCYLMSRDYPYNKKPTKFDQAKFDEAVRDMNKHLDALDQRHKGVFRFHEKHTPFTPANLYLSAGVCIGVGGGERGEEPVVEKKVLNTYNGIEFKQLKVKTALFDVMRHFHANHESSSPQKTAHSPQKRRPPAPDHKCFSSAVHVRHELSSSSEQSSECAENAEDRAEAPAARKKCKTVTVSAKSPVHVLKVDKAIAIDLNQSSDSERRAQSQSQSQSQSEERRREPSSEHEKSDDALRTKLKRVELKCRKLEEEHNQALVLVHALQEDKAALLRDNEALARAQNEVKRKQWCTNCLNEAILPCCWNTCYCTVMCQHEHWPVHAKTCRRKKQ